MRSLIDPESPVLQFITKIVYSVWLNILWFVCSLPVFTLGPATTALFYACQKMVRDEEGYITRSFFRSFRQNFRQGTIIGLIMTGLGGFICFDGFVLLRLYKTSAFWAIVTAVFLVALAAWFIVLMWVFPLLAHSTWKTTFWQKKKNSHCQQEHSVICMVKEDAFLLVWVNLGGTGI